jgi:uncharacterized protein YbjT (DUF2867 family)
MSVMTYVVAGASGNTGKVVAETLLAAGKQVRVIARDESKVSGLVARGATVVRADLENPAELTTALRGAQAAYLLLPPRVQSESVLSDQAKVTESIAQAVAAARVPHVVFLSSIAAQLTQGTGPIASVTNAERRLWSITTSAFTFLRAPYFLENFAGSLGSLADGKFDTFIEPDRRFEAIATIDIGKIAARHLLEGAKRTEVVELHGASDVTVSEACAVFARVLGKPLELRVAPVSMMIDVLSSVGLSRDMARLYAEMTGTLNAGGMVHEGGHRSERGTASVESVARQLLGKPA